LTARKRQDGAYRNGDQRPVAEVFADYGKKMWVRLANSTV
jgi:hypothetical protein